MDARVNERARRFLGLETGGTKLAASVLDDAQHVLVTREIARHPGATARDTLAALVALAREVQHASRSDGLAPTAVGWGFGGVVDRERNRPVVNYHEAGWEQLDATALLATELGAPVFVENDCKVAGLAEAHLGAGSPRGLTVYITLGSGVGGGLIWNGKILASGPYGEGEIGHVCVVPGGARCACGRRGCLEAYCSGWGFGERAKEAIVATGLRTPLAERILAAEPRERAAVLLAAWPDDSFARRQVTDFLEHLADGCAALCLLVSPSRLVFGGGLSRQPRLIDALVPLLAERLPAVMRGHTQVRTARLGAASVSVGAAWYARMRLQKNRVPRAVT